MASICLSKISHYNRKVVDYRSIYCDALPESRNIGGCISDCFLDNGVPNTGNRRIAAVPIQRRRQRTSATQLVGSFQLQRNCYTRCCLSRPPRPYLRQSAREESRQRSQTDRERLHRIERDSTKTEHRDSRL
jgi:hypothetical protein